MNTATILGHDEQVKMLRRSIARGRLPHALLFLGPEGIGKRLVAKRLAQSLLCERIDDAELDACEECPGCKQVKAGSHPDLLEVAKLPGKNELTIEVFVGTGSDRGRGGLNHELSLRPMAGTRRVAIIDDASVMNTEAANALLKTLEEPPAHSLLILIADLEDALLPTIRSRCQVMRFTPLSAQHVQTILEAEAEPDSDADLAQVAMLSEGSIVEARQLLDAELRALRHRIYSALSKASWSPMAVASGVTEALESIGNNPAGQREAAHWMLRFLAELLRQTLQTITTGSSPPIQEASAFGTVLQSLGDEPEDRIARMMDRVASAAGQIERNSPIGLIVESLFHDLRQLCESASKR